MDLDAEPKSLSQTIQFSLQRPPDLFQKVLHILHHFLRLFHDREMASLYRITAFVSFT